MKLISTILTFSLLALMACQEPSVSTHVTSLDHNDIVGKWLLVSANRNGKPTESLKDAYFQFDSPRVVTTNVFGAETSQPISWDESTAMALDSSISYEVVTLKTDTLDLTFQLQRYTFDLTLVRAHYNDSLSISAPLPVSEGH